MKRDKPQKHINPISSKQRQHNQDWHDTCMVKRNHQMGERGWVYCEICGKPENSGIEGMEVWGHHRDKNRNNNSYDNCELAHFRCQANKYHGGNYYIGEVL